jgi:gamma-glutamylaminecyclotransferase
VARLFLYGTLMRLGANHAVLVGCGARFVGEARTASPRTLVDLGPYPALLAEDEARDRGVVHGEMFEVDEAALAELDEFEGCPTLYRREAIEVVIGKDTRERAFTYVLARRAPEDARAIAGGRYDPTCRSGAHD